jgi:hypothetical protein
MNRILFRVLTANAVVLVQCGTLAGCVNKEVGAVARVACGFADVLLTETDLQAVKNAFGESRVGARTCDAVRAFFRQGSGGAEEPIEITAPTQTKIGLPDGTTLTVLIEPP